MPSIKLNTAAASDRNVSTEQSPSASSTIKLSFKKPRAPASNSGESRKRQRDDDGGATKSQESPSTKKKGRANAPPKLLRLSTGDGGLSSGGKKIKLQSRQTPTSSTTPRVTLKAKGKVAQREHGKGYDSEAEDAEADPAIEENIILRMAPGPDCDYLRESIKERKIGLPLSEGGCDIAMRFWQKQADKHVTMDRRAAIIIRGRVYAAVLVDLPCVVESMKSWDRRGWWKSADICQMLLVFQQVENEEAARTAQLPPELDQTTWQWPHGLTPPMYNVRKRRFRKRVSHKTIEAAEKEVEKQLREDERIKNSGGTTTAEILDLDAMLAEDEEDYDDNEDEFAEDELALGYEGGDTVMEGVETRYGSQGEEELEDADDDDDEDAEDAAARIAAQLGGDDEADNDVTEHIVEAPNSSRFGSLTQDDHGSTSGTQREDGPESDDDDDDDGEEDEEQAVEDDDAREKRQLQASQQEEIVQLEQELAVQEGKRRTAITPFFKMRAENKIRDIQADLRVKKKALGIADDDDD